MVQVRPALVGIVLGGVIPKTGGPLSDFNNVPSETGIYYYIVSESTQNKPFPAIVGGVMFVLFALSAEQMYLIMTDSGKICFRKKWNNTWGSWMVLEAW